MPFAPLTCSRSTKCRMPRASNYQAVHQDDGRHCLQYSCLQVHLAELTVALGYDVLMLDADLVLLRPFFQDFQQSAADVLHSQDVPGEARPAIWQWIHRVAPSIDRYLH